MRLVSLILFLELEMKQQLLDDDLTVAVGIFF